MKKSPITKYSDRSLSKGVSDLCINESLDCFCWNYSLHWNFLYSDHAHVVTMNIYMELLTLADHQCHISCAIMYSIIVMSIRCLVHTHASNLCQEYIHVE